MTSKTKTEIKAFFETGDKPTQSQFIDLIDSYLDKSGPLGTLETLASGLSTGFTYFTAGVPSLISYATTAQGISGTDAVAVMTPVVVRNTIEGLYATTAQASAGVSNSTIMTPVLTRNAMGVIQTEATAFATYTNIATTIPLDDTIPQISEGTEVLTMTFTPKSPNSTIEIEFTGIGASGGTIIVALFKDSGVNALAVSTTTTTSVSLTDTILLKYSEASGSTAARTYKIRIGPDAGNAHINGKAATGRLFGGATACRLMIREINANA